MTVNSLHTSPRWGNRAVCRNEADVRHRQLICVSGAAQHRQACNRGESPGLRLMARANVQGILHGGEAIEAACAAELVRLLQVIACSTPDKPLHHTNSQLL